VNIPQDETNRQFLSHFENVRGGLGGKYSARCPAHDDRKNSLSITKGPDRWLLKDHAAAGCPVEAIVQAAGLTLKDLFFGDSRSRKSSKSAPPPREVCAYDYVDEHGILLFQVVRYEPKDFKARRPDGNGGWIYSIEGVRRVLYRLPQVLKAEEVLVVAGEKDVGTAEELGVVATTNPFGEGPGNWKPEFSEFLRGKRVPIVPDCEADGTGIEHAREVARLLLGVAASVKLLDKLTRPDVKDLSDWVAGGGTREGLLAFIQSTPELTTSAEVEQWEQEEEQKEPPATAAEEAEAGLTKSLTDAITSIEHFAVDVGGKLYAFADGVYKPNGASVIGRHVKRLMNELHLSSKWSSYRANQVTEYIAVDAPELWERPPIHVLNVANGLLNVETGTLTAHSPQHLSAVQLPVVFDPRARCPGWERFVGEVFPVDARELAWQIPAWLMLPNTSLQKAILLLGEGGNGKGTYLTAVTAFLGRANVSALTMHKLEEDRFAASRLIGKLANICADLPAAHLQGTYVFKAITGGDPITGEYKFRDSFDFVPFVRLVFSANHPPRSQDSSSAFFQRWLVCPFSRSFRGHPGEIPRDVLDALLAEPTELSGVLNRALAALTGILQRGLLQSESMRSAHAEFQQVTDPLLVWLDRKTVEDSEAVVVKSALLAAYNKAASKARRPTITQTAMTQALARLRPNVQIAQRTVAGKVEYVYVGLGLREEEKSWLS
jgi:putative DNA primase/helicase